MNGMSLTHLTMISAAIVLGSVVIRLMLWGGYRLYLMNFATIFLSSWLVEESCIRFYHFYAYNPNWPLFIDRVPVIIVLIWPLVILSAADLVRSWSSERSKFVLVAAFVVFWDASFIEPVSSNVHLWNWFVPGLFKVPLIGILGWAIFAAFVFWLMPLDEGEFSWKRQVGVLFLPSVGTHLVLLFLWWGGMRWLAVELPVWLILGGAFSLGLALSVFLWLEDLSVIPFAKIILRLPAALFFLFLLVVFWEKVSISLVLFMAFLAFPWFVLSFKTLFSSNFSKG